MYMRADRCQIPAFNFGSIISSTALYKTLFDRALVLDIEEPQGIHVKRLRLTYLLRERGQYDRKQR
jgi:hypothetical protein